MTIASRFVLIPALAFLATGAMALPALSAAHRDLDKAFSAVAIYMQDVARAEADGYVSTVDCVSHPQGTAMGVHYVHHALARDPSLDPTKPEVLLYEPTEDGMRLRGIEFVFALGPPGADIPANPPPRPTMFGQAFAGPMKGHDSEQPPHYDLLVWFDNPAGMFEVMNPKVSCPTE